MIDFRKYLTEGETLTEGKAKITKSIPLKGNWSELRVDADGTTYKVQILHFKEPSKFGIDNGKIFKLTIYVNTGDDLVNYDRGWDIEPPKSGTVKAVYDAVIKAYN